MAKREITESIYKVLFHNQGQIYEVYAQAIYQSDLYGFIDEVEREGIAKVKDSKGDKIMPFPMPLPKDTK